MKAYLAAFALGLAAAAASAQELPTAFRTQLSTVAFVPADGPFAGEGNVTASVQGRQIRFRGEFTGLDSSASRVRVLSGIGVGVPGNRVIAQLNSSPAGPSGTFSGQAPATAENVALLRANRLYVQIDTQKAQDGALWGWLMEDHPIPAQGVPERSNPYAR
jgi:hypothetical protein